MAKYCVQCGSIMSESVKSDLCYSCELDKHSAKTKYKPIEDVSARSKYSLEEKTLVILGRILLIVGFIAAIFIIAAAFQKEEFRYGGFYDSRMIFKFQFIAYAICDMLLSLTLWAAMICIAKTSRNIREMKNNK